MLSQKELQFVKGELKDISYEYRKVLEYRIRKKFNIAQKHFGYIDGYMRLKGENLVMISRILNKDNAEYKFYVSDEARRDWIGTVIACNALVTKVIEWRREKIQNEKQKQETEINPPIEKPLP